jgi:TatA/E family protein of Tat protein translocase
VSAVFGGLRIGELVLLFLLLLLMFGAKRIPQIARGIGEGIRNFKSGVKDPERLAGSRDPEKDDSDRDS